MSSLRCLCRYHGPRKLEKKPSQCCCDWEIKIAYGVAISLAVFEAKRFILIVLELLAEWQVIRIAGGFLPVILSFLNISLGFPCALGVVHAIRRKQEDFYDPNINKYLKFLLVLTILCTIFNMATIFSVSYNVSVKKKSVTKTFNASMHFYVTASTYKYTIDQIQFIFQCCGHSSYLDWFHLNWQKTNGYEHEETNVEKSVPFSCCKITTPPPCINTEITQDVLSTINTRGCSGVLSNILIRIVFFAYSMGAMLIFAQGLLVVCIIRILKKSVKTYLRFSCHASQCLLPSRSGNYRKKLRRSRKRLRSCLKNPEIRSTGCQRESSVESSSGFHAAMIRPSIHVEQYVSGKRT